ncbi:MAG: hypothetical protein KDB37_15890, partial [Ilumatobacter sp.]|nr:hypothetical protein [Ilumatobacter sp.]
MASSTNRRRSIAGMLAAAVILTGCWGGGDDDATSDTTLAPGPTVTVAPDDPIVTIDGQPTDSGDDVELGVRLSDGTAGGDDTDPSTPVAEGTALEQTQIDAIVDQLPEWSVPDTDQVDFLRPATSLEPDSIGEFIRARLGDEVHERLVDSLIGSIYAADTDRFSLAEVPQLAGLAAKGRSLILTGRKLASGSGTAAAADTPVFSTPRAGLSALARATAAAITAAG